MTEEQRLLILNTIMYEDSFITWGKTNSGSGSIYDWAKTVVLPQRDTHGDAFITEPTPEQKDALTILAHPEIFQSMVVQDMTEREYTEGRGEFGTEPITEDEYAIGAAQMIVTTPGETLFVFQGTDGSTEWIDDGNGGAADVTDTLIQQDALKYYLDHVGDFPADSIVVTGHSKGGNLASYIAVLSQMGFMDSRGNPIPAVDDSYSFDGQGFNQAFIDKYQDEIEAIQAHMHTSANSVDFVNILFDRITGINIYYQDPGEDIVGFENNHQPYAMLDWDEQTQTWVMRQGTPISPLMSLVDEFVQYAQAFMTADSFETLCDMAMGLKIGTVGMGDLIDPAGLAALIAELSVPGVGLELAALNDGLFQIISEPYRPMIEELLTLLGGYSDAHGIDPEAMMQLLRIINPDLADAFAAIDAVLPDPPPGVPGAPAGTAGTSALELILSGAPDVPYSEMVRDYSLAVLEELMRISDEVGVTPWWDPSGWNIWERIWDLFSDIDIPADSARLDEYYHRIIEMKNVSKGKIRRIFADVESEERRFTTEMRSTLDEILSLEASLALVAGQ
ncbi:MAG: DUF2974 domain-containing protein [Propionibacteriaceae bacterium]|nr:DUF2974 domain-containing protein [Propionibacteriaceae bacterium]